MNFNKYCASECPHSQFYLDCIYLKESCTYKHLKLSNAFTTQRQTAEEYEQLGRVITVYSTILGTRHYARRVLVWIYKRNERR